MQGCVMLRTALKCIKMHLGDYSYSQVEPLTSIVAEKPMSAADYKIEVDSPAGRPRAQAQHL